jgi:hypothetical protein
VDEVVVVEVDPGPAADHVEGVGDDQLVRVVGVR